MCNRFIELNWLAKSDKDILLPVVVFEEIKTAGVCMFPVREEKLIGERYYPRDRGIIVIHPDHPGVASTLAHEWRHLWQVYNLGWPDECSWWDSESSLSYKQQIIEFFTSDVRETDALLFERKKATCEVIEQWYEWIIKRGE